MPANIANVPATSISAATPGTGLTLAAGVLSNDLATGVGRLLAAKTPPAAPSCFGDVLAAATGAAHQVEIGNTTGISAFVVGQSATRALRFIWGYNATPANASGILDTFGFSNPITVDCSLLTLNGISGQSVIVGGAAIATTATIGFLCISKCAGTPTGVPANTNGIATVYDTTANKIWFYNGSWRGVLVA